MSCSSLYHWREGAICLQSWHQIPRKIFPITQTQIPFWVSSQVLIICHDNIIITKCLWKHSQHQVQYFKQQNSRHAHNNSNMRNTAIKPIKNNFYFSSWCLPQICQQLQVLNAFKNVALAIVIERHYTHTTTKRTLNNEQNNIQTKSCLLRQSVCLPPFKLMLDVCVQPYRLLWKQQVNLELTRINYSLVASPDELKCLWHSAQGYTRRYSRVPCTWTYPRGGKRCRTRRWVMTSSWWNTPNATRGLFDHLKRWGFNIPHFHEPRGSSSVTPPSLPGCSPLTSPLEAMAAMPS